MIVVLTRERQVRGQLSILLRDLGYAPAFFNSLVDFEAAVEVAETAESRQPVLLDMGMPDAEDIIRRMKQEQPNTRIIAFARFESSARRGSALVKPERVDGFFVLPPHADRAKARILSALRAQNSRESSHRSLKKSPLSQLLKRPGGSLSRGAKRSPGSGEGSGTDTNPARYIEVRSPASLRFLEQIRRVPSDQSIILIRGKEGAEYELAARELNYQNGADAEQLLFGSAEGLKLERLERLEKLSAKDRKNRLCYIGRSDELSLESAEQLGLFLEFLSSLRDPHLRIVLAHEDGSELFFQEGVEAVLRPFFAGAAELNLPGIDTRPEDIRPISLALIANLRAAHTFIRVKSLSEEAIQYLIDNRGDFSHAKLLRTLRNACAVCEREELQPTDIKNFGEHEASTSHLMESMADEEYFPCEAAI